MEKGTTDAPWPVLVVDDDAIVRKLLRRALEESGFQVTVASGGQEALDRLQTAFFPIVVTDWIMPEVDGLTLCRAIRENESRGYVFILLVTSRSTVTDIVAGLEAGADDYLIKPFSNAELLARIRTGTRILDLERSLTRASDMLVQSEKLAAIGQLAAGVAHEILNPTNIVSMRLQLLEMTESLSQRGREALGVCDEQLKRIVDITKDLGQFSRTSRQHVPAGDINALVSHAVELIQPQLRIEDIGARLELAPELPTVPMDQNRIEQVLINLLANAVAAMDGLTPRQLRVVTSLSEDDPRQVRIAVSDTGRGLSREELPRIFDPYFTTKPPEKGTGLGLYLAYGIMADHGGRIWAENNRWGGATFNIELSLEGAAPKVGPQERSVLWQKES